MQKFFIAIGISLFLCTSSCAQVKNGSEKYPKPVVFTAEQDHNNMMKQLGISELRPGASGNSTDVNHANYDETMANPCPTLPDLLTTNAGERVYDANIWWRVRRPEIAKAFEQEVYGSIPDGVPTVKWTAKEIKDTIIDGVSAVSKMMIGHVDNSNYPLIGVDIKMLVVLPTSVKTRIPVLMMFSSIPPFSFYGQQTGTPATTQLLKAGWGYALIDPNSIQADNGSGLTRGIIGLVNKGQPRTPEQWGALRAWAWGAARGLDYLETEPLVDAKKVGIEGVSRYGKAAIVTLAFEQRFAIGLIGSSGKGGVTLHRRNFGEAVENLTGGEYYWMCGNYMKYGAKKSTFGELTGCDLTVDSHGLIALCAPRPTFISYGIPEQGDALWLDQLGSYKAVIAAGSVYKLLGMKDLGVGNDYINAQMPPVLTSLLDGQLAWRQHNGGHTDLPNFPYFIAWANKMLKYNNH